MDARVFEKSDAVAWRVVDGHAVVISLEDGVMHDFNETATAIWTRVVEGKPVHDIVSSVREEFEIDEGEAAADVEAFLAQLSAAGLVVERSMTGGGRP